MANPRTDKTERDEGTQSVDMASELVDRTATDMSQRSAQNVEILSQATGVMVSGFQQVTRELFNWHQEMMRESLDRIGRDGLMPRMFTFQGDLARDSLQRSLDGARRVGEAFIRMSEQAQQAIDRSQDDTGRDGRRTQGRSDDEGERGPRQHRGPRAA